MNSEVKNCLWCGKDIVLPNKPFHPAKKFCNKYCCSKYHTANRGKRSGYIFSACTDCGTVRRVPLVNGKPIYSRCSICSNKRLKVKRLPLTYEPTAGEIRNGLELQILNGNLNPGQKYIWIACIDCGKPRWVALDRNNVARSKRCSQCRNPKGTESPFWKGGRRQSPQRYILITLHPDDFYFSMTHKYNPIVFEHRLVMAKYLGRCLQPWERVHHKNGLRDDNRIENLELTCAGSHTIMHSKGYRDGYAKGLIDGREKQIEELKQEIKLLRWQLIESKKL